MRRTKQITRRKFPAEEKIRILLEGIRAELSVADLSLQNLTLKKSLGEGFTTDGGTGGCTRSGSGRCSSWCSGSQWPSGRAWPRSTYCRWQRRWRQAGDGGLVDRRPAPGTVWNRIRPAEEATIRAEALRQPDRSPRELACWLTDHAGCAVSESTVYRVKTTRANEPWQSDASDFFVVGRDGTL